MKLPSFKTLVIPAAVAGTMDILAAFLSFFLRTGKNPVVVLHLIASALLGPAALKGDGLIALLGLALHYVIAFLFTAFFFTIMPHLIWLGNRWWLTAVLYGLFVWSVMNLVVVPLSRIPPHVLQPGEVLRGMVILVVCIGLPLSLLWHRRQKLPQ